MKKLGTTREIFIFSNANKASYNSWEDSGSASNNYELVSVTKEE